MSQDPQIRHVLMKEIVLYSITADELKALESNKPLSAISGAFLFCAGGGISLIGSLLGTSVPTPVTPQWIALLLFMIVLLVAALILGVVWAVMPNKAKDTATTIRGRETKSAPAGASPNAGGTG